MQSEADWSDWSERAATAGDDIRATGQWREIRSLSKSGTRANTESGHAVVQFASNDYLGLSTHPDVIEAAAAATREWGAGSAASRLVVGSRPIHDRLERSLAEWKSADAALLFPTGYAANLGVLTSLARLSRHGGRPIAIVSDELNHASIIDGARLSGAPVSVFRHGEVEAAEAHVDRHRTDGFDCVVVSDSVFSMDGDLAPIADLAAMAQRTSSLLILDDAHSVFPQVSTTSLGAEVLVVSTLSKSLGSLGGFVAGSRPLIDWLRNTARSFIFSTATSPGSVAAAQAALDIVRSAEGAELVARLRSHVDRLIPNHPSAVIPVVVGGADEAMATSDALLERGLLVPAIRPPTVAPGTSRLRVALSAAHTDSELDSLMCALRELGLWS